MRLAIGATKTVGLCFGLGLALAGCSGGATNAGDVFGNLLAFNSVNAPPMPNKALIAKVDCPTVDVADSGGTQRVYAGPNQNNDTVKYQFDIAHYARQCKVVGDQIAIKVGVQGRALIGPAGAAGAYVAPLRIAIERQSDNSVVAQQIFRTPVEIPAGTGEKMFEVISQPFMVPYPGEHADTVYSIIVGFGNSAATHAPKEKLKRRRRKG